MTVHFLDRCRSMARFGTGFFGPTEHLTAGPQRPGRRPSWSGRLLAATLLAGVVPLGEAEGAPAIDRATALRAEGKLDEALEVLRSESRDVKRVAGEDSLSLLVINDLAAEILIDQGSLDAAESLLTKVIATRERLIEDGRKSLEADLATSLVTLARLQLQARRHADAAASTVRALRIQDRTSGPAGDKVAGVQANLDSLLDSAEQFLGSSDRTVLESRESAATAYEELGMFSAAARQRRKLLAGIKDQPGQVTPERIATVERSCRQLMLMGHADEAVPIAEQAIPEATATAPAGTALDRLRLVGELQLAAGQFILADASFKGAGDLTEATKAARPSAATRDRLNRLLTDLRRGNAASPPAWFQSDLKRLAGAPATDRDAAAALPIAATILVALGEPAAAAEQLAKGLASARSPKQPEATAIADLSGRLAAALLAAGKHAAALDVAKKALAEVGPKLGPGDARVAFLRIMLADAQRRKDDGAATASATLREALGRELPRPDDAWEERVIEVVDAVAASAPDERLRERFVEARARQFGAEHRHVGMTWSLFGAMRLASGDWAAAVDMLTRSLAVLRADLGDDHPEVAATQALLAHAKRGSVGSADAAEALAAWERLAGPEHPGTLAALDVLVSARLRDDVPAEVETLLERLCSSGSSFTPIQQAGHLVRLAMVVLPSDRPRAEACLERATALPCWDSDAAVRPRDLDPLALTAARAAYVYKQLGQLDRSADALQLARSWATRSDNAKVLLERVEQLAKSGRFANDA